MKIQVEMEDNLQEILAKIQEGIKEELLRFIKSNPDYEKVPDFLTELDDSGVIREIIDNYVPRNTKEIKDLWYLYGEKFEQSFDLAGLGDKNDKDWPLGWKPAAIFTYLQDQCYEWYDNNATLIVQKYKKNQDKERIKKIVKKKSSEEKNLL